MVGVGKVLRHRVTSCGARVPQGTGAGKARRSEELASEYRIVYLIFKVGQGGSVGQGSDTPIP
jgi:hypothetical protein